MDIVKFCVLAVIISFAIVFTKQVKPELAIFVSVAGASVMLIYILGFFSNIIVLYNNIVLKTGINTKYFSILIKAIGIGYLVEFASNVCKDSGNTAIADKVVLFGKISILLLSSPIISDIFSLVGDIL